MLYSAILVLLIVHKLHIAAVFIILGSFMTSFIGFKVTKAVLGAGSVDGMSNIKFKTSDLRINP